MKTKSINQFKIQADLKLKPVQMKLVKGGDDDVLNINPNDIGTLNFNG